MARINAELGVLLFAVSCADPPADDESLSFTGATAPMDATETTTAGPATEPSAEGTCFAMR